MRISKEEAKSIIDSDSYDLILDVRTEEEYKEGHIRGALNYPVEKLMYNLPDYLSAADRSDIILVYCRSGVRSEAADSILENAGFKNVKDFGGIINFNYPDYIV